MVDGLLGRFVGIFFHVVDETRVVCDADGAVETAAVAGHSFEKVFGRFP